MALKTLGKAPAGARLERIKQSSNFRDGKFQNLNHTPELTEGYTMAGVMRDFLLKKKVRVSPSTPIPSIKTNLLELPQHAEILVWFGHSSYFLQTEGIKILIDPVFSGNASPIPATTKAFKGADVYSVADLPYIDYLFISHDHYDHLDYPTIKQLHSKVGKVVCGLGVGAHFEHWGYNATNIIENDWYDQITLGNNLTAHVLPARHFSGRSFTRCNTLWCSFLLQSPDAKIYLGGDSGYDTHYKAIHEQFGDIDLAILDNGQYDKAWEYIHHHPHQVVEAAKDLKAKRLLPVHSSKFILANHPWDEPLNQVAEHIKNTDIKMLTPMIGELLHLKDTQQQFKQWWKEIS